ncbi:MAG: LamG domain-containing protein [Bacteroidota bacterium]|nr:LamG domain-containing protein [Bacteroidota bacterium]
MILKNISFKWLTVLVAVVAVSSCQKMKKPELASNYPTDQTVTPTTELRFYLNFDSTTADDKQINLRFKDSISAYPSFFPPSSVSYAAGVRGTAYKGALDGYIHYLNANDFAKSTNFTIAFWLKTTIAEKDHNNADGILAIASTTNFWSNAVIFADHESSTSDSMQLKFHFANGSGDNWDFAGYTGGSRWPHMYDGQWHHVAFVYNSATKTATLYRDGVQFDQKTNETIAFDGHESQVVVGGFQEAASIVDTYANNSWMSGFPGLLDNIRLYNKALSTAEVLALYTNKL